MRRRAAVLLAALALLLAAPAALAQQSVVTPGAESGVSEVVRALASDPVHVDPDAEHAITGAEADALRERISSRNAGPMYVAILPGSVRDQAGGDAAQVARRIAIELNRPGTYAVVAGSQFRAGSVNAGLDRGVAPELATTAFERKRDAGVAATLTEFVDLVGEAKAGGGENPVDPRAPGTGGFGGLGLLALLGGGIGLVAWRRRRQRRREAAEQVADLRETARDDLVALGDDVRALDLDVQMPGADAQAQADYAIAVERYGQAERLLDKAADPAHFGPIGQALEEGRYAMAAAKARFAGQPVPERRPPCFFDPRHGPSTRDVEWAPDGYQPRPVPVCEADAVRLESGQHPMTREIVTGGRRVALYDAPGFYAPYAGGFFGGFTGFLPGLLFGSMLGTGLGALTSPAWADPGGWEGGGDLGGGDFGFGGGGLGDFGGGGDFGGFGGGDF